MGIHNKYIPFICLPFLLVFAEVTPSQSASLHLTETLVIGEDQSEEMAYIFGQPDKVHADADGNIYASDRSDHTIRVFETNLDEFLEE